MTPGYKALLETVNLSALGLWAGVTAMAGAAAGVTFPVVKALDARAPAFDAYNGEQWRIVGGHIGEKLFLINDIVAFVASLLAAATLGALIVLRGVDRSKPVTIIRALATSIALAAAAGQILIVSRSMNSALNAYWAAAQAGDNEAAAFHQSQFDQLHPISTWMLGLMFLSTLAAFVAGLRSLTTARAALPDAPKSTYETPKLASGARR